MMHDSAPQIDPVLNLARDQMEMVADIHKVHLAIVSGKDETQVLQFSDTYFERTMGGEIPSLIREIGALGVIVSSPTGRSGRYGAIVTLIDRTIEAFYAPIVRIINAETMVGDFRLTDIETPNLFGRIHAELLVNWASRGQD